MRNAAIVCSVAAAAAFVVGQDSALAHCQMPCGIYGDELRFKGMQEDATTIRKAMTQVKELSADFAKNTNQVVRWVDTKEKAADRIAETMSEYFLQQRVKAPVSQAATTQNYYVSLLKLCHGILVQAMLCKQSTDPAVVDRLDTLLKDFQKEYGKGP